MRRQRRFGVAILGMAAFSLLVGGAGAARAEILYAATGSGGINGELVTLNIGTGAVATDIGPLVDSAGHHYGLTGLAFQPGTGVLFGSTTSLSPTAPASLVIVNPNTARVTVVGPFNQFGATMSDITFRGGQLYGNSGASGEFYSINTKTGAATDIGPTGVGVTFGGGLAANSHGIIFGSPQPGPGDLFTYNPLTGHATDVATLTGAPLSGAINALSFDAGDVLFGINNSQGGPFSQTHLIRIGPVTGQITDIGPSLSNLDALAFLVPEPASLTLFGIGAVGLLGYAWRKRKQEQA
jgi:hypothetical protein